MILQNEKNLNVVIEKDTNTGIVYKNDTEKYIHLNKSDIIDQSLTKLRLQLNSLCNEICVKKNGNVENIEKQTIMVVQATPNTQPGGVQGA